MLLPAESAVKPNQQLQRATQTPVRAGPERLAQRPEGLGLQDLGPGPQSRSPLVSSCAEHQTRQSSTPRSRYCELVQNSEVKFMRIIRYRHASIAIPMAVIIIKVRFDEENLTSKCIGCDTVDRSRIQNSILRAQSDINMPGLRYC